MQKVSNIKDALGLAMECHKTPWGMKIEISGIVTVREYSSEKITLVTHGGAVTLSGERLSMSGFVNQAVELFGKVKSIEFGYGKR